MTVGLLERESTGGATARVGFEYQDAYVLQSLPRWLAQSAFSHVVSEAVGDVEVCYFGPDAAVRRMMLESKDYALTAPAFWEEVQRFKNAHSTSPLEFVRFGLVCRDYNTKTSRSSRSLRGCAALAPPTSRTRSSSSKTGRTSSNGPEPTATRSNLPSLRFSTSTS